MLPVPFPLGLDALPHWSHNWACPQVEPTSSFEKRVEEHTLNTRLINESSATLTNDPTLGLCSGPAHEAGLSVMRETGHASCRMVNRDVFPSDNTKTRSKSVYVFFDGSTRYSSYDRGTT